MDSAAEIAICVRPGRFNTGGARGRANSLANATICVRLSRVDTGAALHRRRPKNPSAQELRSVWARARCAPSRKNRDTAVRRDFLRAAHRVTCTAAACARRVHSQSSPFPTPYPIYVAISINKNSAPKTETICTNPKSQIPESPGRVRANKRACAPGTHTEAAVSAGAREDSTPRCSGRSRGSGTRWSC